MILDKTAYLFKEYKNETLERLSLTDYMLIHYFLQTWFNYSCMSSSLSCPSFDKEGAAAMTSSSTWFFHSESFACLCCSRVNPSKLLSWDRVIGRKSVNGRRQVSQVPPLVERVVHVSLNSWCLLWFCLVLGLPKTWHAWHEVSESVRVDKTTLMSRELCLLHRGPLLSCFLDSLAISWCENDCFEQTNFVLTQKILLGIQNKLKKFSSCLALHFLHITKLFFSNWSFKML